MLAFRLLHPAGTRSTWWAVGALCGVASAATVWAAVATTGALSAVAVALTLAVLYAWIADGAVRMARSARRVLEIYEDRIEVTHDGMLVAPIVVARSAIEAVTIDDRPAADRKVAASVRRGNVAPPSFLNPDLPVVSVAPSSHSRYGASAAPNVTIMLRESVIAPRVPRSIRTLIRIGTGKSGRYCGPKPGEPMKGLRVALEDPAAFVRALADWNVLTALPRDERYLAPVRARDRKQAARGRLVTAGIIAGMLALGLLQRALRS